MLNKKPYAKKSFGQNFLVDQNYINKIISALNPQKGETIIEIGAGRGALTEKLVESGVNIIAVELERDMIAVLKEKFADKENFHLAESDALKVNFFELISKNINFDDRNLEISRINTKFKGENVNVTIDNSISKHDNLISKRNNFISTDEASRFKTKLVANLPYYISTAILQKLIEQREVFSEMILMFQKEVVTRITAEAGNKERGFLTVLVEAYLHAEKLFDVPPNAFRPAPKVWSAVVKLKPKSNNNFADEKLFKSLISAAFKQKRKTIWNNLNSFAPNNDFDVEKWKEIFSGSEISPERRAETLTIQEWKKLFDSLISVNESKSFLFR